jgi:hypothetical protein
LDTKKPKTGSGGKSVKAVRDSISKLGKDDGFVPPKPLPKKVKERKTKYDIPISKEQSDFNLRLFNLYTLFRVVHSKQEGSPTILRSIKDKDSALEMMQNFFRENTDWDDTQINMLSNNRILEESNSTDFLIQFGFGKRINTKWHELGAAPMIEGEPVFTKKDGTNSIKIEEESSTRKWLPPVSTTYRKHGKKYYIEISDLELTDNIPSLADLTDNFDSWIHRISDKQAQEDTVSIEPDLSRAQIQEPVDAPIDPNTPLTYKEILKKSEGTLKEPETRQKAIREAKERREERRLQKQRGYVDKPGTSKPPAELGAPKMPSLTRKAAGRSALPSGGGFPSKKLTPKFRIGGFVPYST